MTKPDESIQPQRPDSRQKAVENESIQAPRLRIPALRLAKGQEVSLGCGTLILIAIIVAVCSGAGRTDITPLQNKQEQMHKALMRIEDRLNEISKKLDGKQE